MVEDRHYYVQNIVFHVWPKLISTLQRGLSAIAELLVNICVKVGDLTISSSV